MKESERLIKKIKPLFDFKLPDDLKIKRTYAGKWDKLEDESTFLSYYYSEKKYNFCIGIYVPIRQLLKCPNLIVQKEYLPNLYSVKCGCANDDCSCDGIKKPRIKPGQ